MIGAVVGPSPIAKPVFTTEDGQPTQSFMGTGFSSVPVYTFPAVDVVVPSLAAVAGVGSVWLGCLGTQMP
jgi:hypothetical protein